MILLPKLRKSFGKNKEKPRRSGVFWVLIQRGKKLFDLFLRQGGEQFPRHFSQVFHIIIRIHYVFLLNEYPKGTKNHQKYLTKTFYHVRTNKSSKTKLFYPQDESSYFLFCAFGCLRGYGGPPVRSPGRAGTGGSRQLIGSISHGHPSFRQKHTTDMHRPSTGRFSLQRGHFLFVFGRL